MNGRPTVSGSVSVVRRVLAAAVKDIGEIWSNRAAARHIGRMTVGLGLRQRSGRPSSSSFTPNGRPDGAGAPAGDPASD